MMTLGETTTMPVFRRSEDGPSRVEECREGRLVAYELTREGEMFLTQILTLRDGDPTRPSDLQLLIDRGWASLVPELASPDVVALDPPSPAPGPLAPQVEPEAASAEASTPGRGGAGRRTRGREVALQVLYLLEQNPAVDAGEVERFLTRRLRDAKAVAFTRGLVEGVHAHQDHIDGLISGVAENWRLDRMAAIDRNILRLGAYEMLYCPDVPKKVAINEALELAKRYSTAQSSRFVNGILDRLQDAKPEPEARPMAEPGDAPGAEPSDPGPS
jgi:N utilization substance protein B